jgi:hypothetical protein
MGFKGDKSIVYTKNKFEAYLNSIESNEWWDNLDIESRGVINNYPNSKYRDRIGNVFRTHFKDDFNREYLIWLNTK